MDTPLLRSMGLTFAANMSELGMTTGRDEVADTRTRSMTRAHPFFWPMPPYRGAPRPPSAQM